MQIRQAYIYDIKQLKQSLSALAEISPQLVLVFAAPQLLLDGNFFPALSRATPGAQFVGCSTAGEIGTEGSGEEGILITALRFEHPAFRVVEAPLAGMADSSLAGFKLGQQLMATDLRGVLLFGQGVGINGSALIEGMTEVLGSSVPITGGLAGDGTQFRQTWVLTPRGVSDSKVVAIGFYGEHWQLGHGCFGGWKPFGPLRKITRAQDNLLYELDGESALAIYKRYLGEYANDLPSSGLLFPFEMLDDEQSDTGVIRTILGVDETAGSLLLAGNVNPEGYLRLMYSSPDALVEGAEEAAQLARQMLPGSGETTLALLVSCIGRKLVMGGGAEEEVEAVAQVLGANVTLAGFYSYGEVSPALSSGECLLHNQTMTITCLSERAA